MHLLWEISSTNGSKCIEGNCSELHYTFVIYYIFISMRNSDFRTRSFLMLVAANFPLHFCHHQECSCTIWILFLHSFKYQIKVQLLKNFSTLMFCYCFLCPHLHQSNQSSRLHLSQHSQGGVHSCVCTLKKMRFHRQKFKEII